MRKRHACRVCIKGRKKCDGAKPTCSRCFDLNYECAYDIDKPNSPGNSSPSTTLTSLTPQNPVSNPTTPNYPTNYPNYHSPTNNMNPVQTHNMNSVQTQMVQPMIQPHMQQQMHGGMHMGMQSHIQMSQLPQMSPMSQVPPPMPMIYSHNPMQYTWYPMEHMASTRQYPSFQNLDESRRTLMNHVPTNYSARVEPEHPLLKLVKSSRHEKGNYYHVSPYDEFFALPKYFAHKTLYTLNENRQPTMNPEHFHEFMPIIIDASYASAFMSHFSFVYNPFELGEIAFMSCIPMALGMIDDLSSLQDLSQAKHLEMMAHFFKRTLRMIESKVLDTDIEAKEIVGVAMALCAISSVYINMDRRTSVSVRHLRMAVSLIQEIRPYDSRLSPLLQEIAQRIKWWLFVVDQSGCAVTNNSLDYCPAKMMLDEPLPLPDAIFQVYPSNRWPRMSTLNQISSPQGLHQHWPYLSPWSVICLICSFRERIARAKQHQDWTEFRELQEMFQFLAANIPRMPIPPGLSTSDPIFIHPSLLMMQLQLSWADIHLPKTLSEMLDSEWCMTQEFSLCLEHIGATIFNKLVYNKFKI